MTQVEVNDVGDMVVTDAAALRALADPVRLRLMDRLTRGGQPADPDARVLPADRRRIAGR